MFSKQKSKNIHLKRHKTSEIVFNRLKYPKIVRNIGSQKYWVSEISGLRNIRSQKYQVSEILGHRNIGSQKYRVSDISGLRNIECQKYRVTVISGHRNIGSQENVSELSCISNIRYLVSSIHWENQISSKVYYLLIYYYLFYLTKPRYIFDFPSLDQSRSKNNVPWKVIYNKQYNLLIFKFYSHFT